MTTKRWIKAAKGLAAGVLLASAGVAQADFVAIGSDQVLDTTTNLVWLKNWNLGAGSSFDNAGLGSSIFDGSSTTDGLMTWANANSWAASLTTGGVAAGTWRLPTGDGHQTWDGTFTRDGIPFVGSDNEFLQLWFDVRPGSSGLVTDSPGTLAALQAQFNNVPDAVFYWSGSDLGSGHETEAWSFNTRTRGGGPLACGLGAGSVFCQETGGNNFNAYKDQAFFAVAVRSGDVVAAVPEPESLALVLVGLMAAGVARRRRPL